MIVQNIRIINVSNRTFFLTVLASMLLLYFFYVFNSCLMSSINRVFKRVSGDQRFREKQRLKLLFQTGPFNLIFSSTTIRETSVTTHNEHFENASSSEETQIIFGSVVRIVSLTDDDVRNESSFKYRLVNPKNLSARRLPDVLLIGVKKSGTRALLEFIRVHPDVRAAGNEIHFFDRHYSFGLNWYRKKMPPTITGQLTMEKTPSYFVTASAPARVHKMNPKIKLLVVVRNPVTRAISGDFT